MKKLILIFCLLFSVSSFAQKTHYFDQIGFVAGGSLYKNQQFTDSIAFDNIFYSSAFRRKTVNNVSYIVPKWVNDKISYPGIKQYTHHYSPTRATLLIYNPNDKIIYCQDEAGGGDPGIILEDFAVRNIISYDSLGTNIPTVFGPITVQGSIHASDITLSDVAADLTPATLFSSSAGHIKTFPISSLPFAGSSHNHAGVYEPVLSHPTVSGQVLTSTTAGVKSWTSLPSSQDISAKVNIIGNSFSGIYVVTQAQYDAIIVKDTMILYFIK